MTIQWTKSTCPYCGFGCGLNVGVRSGDIIEVRGLKGHPINDGKICHLAANLPSVFKAEGRLEYPMLKKEGQLHRTTWKDAIEQVSNQLRQIMTDYGSNAIAFYGGAVNFNEEYYLMNKLMKGLIRSNNVECSTRLCMASTAAGFISTFGADAPPTCYADIEKADLFFIAGNNMAVTIPVLFNQIKKAKEKNQSKVIVVDPRKTETAEIADLHLQIKPGTDVALNNALANVLLAEGLVDEENVNIYASGFSNLKEFIKKYTPEFSSKITGCSEELIIKAAKLIGNSKTMLTFWFQGYNHSTQAVFKNNTLHNISLLTGNICKPGAGPMSITGEANALGNRWIGALSQLLPGMRSVSNAFHRQEIADYWKIPADNIDPIPGKTIIDIIKDLHEGHIKALWVMTTNPAASLPNSKWIVEGLKKAELLIVQDIFHPTETTQLADVIFPAAQWAEKTGTFISSERRIELTEKLIDPPGEAKPDYDIIIEVAKAMGYQKYISYSSPEEIFEELKGITTGRICDMSGVSYQRLRNGNGIQLPCPDADHPGTSRLFSNMQFSRADGRAALLCREFKEPAETVSEEFPFILITGKLAHHFNTRTRTTRISRLNKLSRESVVEINPNDAVNLGIMQGDNVKITSERGSVNGCAEVSDRILKGTVYINMHYGDVLNIGKGKLANIATNTACDMHSKQPEFKISAVKIMKA